MNGMQKAYRRYEQATYVQAKCKHAQGMWRA